MPVELFGQGIRSAFRLGFCAFRDRSVSSVRAGISTTRQSGGILVVGASAHNDPASGIWANWNNGAVGRCPVETCGWRGKTRARDGVAGRDSNAAVGRDKARSRRASSRKNAARRTRSNTSELVRTRRKFPVASRAGDSRSGVEKARGGWGSRAARASAGPRGTRCYTRPEDPGAPGSTLRGLERVVRLRD